jgi:hypothetical protein
MTIATLALTLGLIIQNSLSDSSVGGAITVVLVIGALALLSIHFYLRHTQERARLAQLDYELNQRISPQPEPPQPSPMIDPHATQPVTRQTARVEVNPLEPPAALNEDIMVLALELKRLRSRQDLILGLVALTAVIVAGAFGLGVLTNRPNSNGMTSVVEAGTTTTSARAVGGEEQEKHDGPHFDPTPYFNRPALTETFGVVQPEAAASQPDGKFAVIKPGGQLTLTFADGSYYNDGPGKDVRVVGRLDNPVRYRILVRDGPRGAFTKIDFGQGQGEHDMGHHHIHRSSFVQIRNEGRDDLAIDSVQAFYK